MNPVLESLAIVVINSLYTMGKPKIAGFFSDLQKKDKNLHAGTLNMAQYGVTLLRPKVTATETKIDDAFLDDVQQAITDSATSAGVVL